MIFYYIRHGYPIYNPDSLTEYGKQQAEALAKRFLLYGLDEIYSSPSNRALQTAQATCNVLNKEPTILDWTNEALVWDDFTIESNGRRTWFFNDQKSVAEFSSPRMLALGKNWTDNPYFKDSTIKTGMQRVDTEVDNFFLKLGFKHNREEGGYEVVEPNEKRIALFAHQGFGLAFLSSLLDIPYPMFCTKFDIGHSGVTVIYFNERNKVAYPRVLQLSNDSHLYKEDILKGYQGKIDI